MTRHARTWFKLKNTIHVLEERLNELKRQKSEIEKALIEELFDNTPGTVLLDSKQFPGIALRYMRVESRRVDSEALKREMPKIYEKYCVKYTYDRLIQVQAGDASQMIEETEPKAKKDAK